MASARLLTGRREILAEGLAAARRATDDLFGLLRPEALLERPIPERHRLIFYLGHLEAFDRNLAAQAGFAVDSGRADLDRLLAFGIDPVDGALPAEPASAWPAESDIREYDERVRRAFDRCLEEADLDDPRRDAARLFHTAIEHRLMHAETLAYGLHQLPADMKRAPAEEARGAVAEAQTPPEPRPLPRPRPGPPPPPPPVTESGESRRPGGSMILVPPGRVTLGLARGGRFGWDNEFETHAVDVPAFAIGAFKVTNGEFLEFVRAGGYDTPEPWRRADWNWIRGAGRRHPAFWRAEGSGWLFRGMFRDRPLAMDEPVWVSHAEAAAYARWKGARLPTEAEWHRAACGAPDGHEREHPWGDAPPSARHGLFDGRGWDPAPGDAHPAGRSPFGVWDLVGNGWEWTSTVFAPFAGFDVYPLYRGYSTNFFDGRHFVLKGGSPRTPAPLLRRSFRNWFQPHYPYVYAGFRLVRA